MRKTDYVEAVMDEVEEFLSINDIQMIMNYRQLM